MFYDDRHKNTIIDRLNSIERIIITMFDFWGLCLISLMFIYVSKIGTVIIDHIIKDKGFPNRKRIPPPAIVKKPVI
jgi:hypothetical protein